MAVRRERPPRPAADSPPLVVCLGPTRAGKTYELVRQYREILQQIGSPGQSEIGLDRALWLAPNSAAADDVRRQLLSADLAACLRPGVVTFEQLAGQVLADAQRTPSETARRLDPLAARELLRRVVASAREQNALEFFGEAAARTGFIDLLAEHIRELKRRNIDPEAYARIGPHRGDPRQHRELAQLYADYEQELKSHHLNDSESVLLAANEALKSGNIRRYQSLELIVVDGFTDFTRIQLDILHQLAQQTQRLFISLPTDTPVNAPPRTGRLSDQSQMRHDLFAKASATLVELHRQFPKLEELHFAARPSVWPAIDHLTQHIFRHPAQIPAPSHKVLSSLDQLEIAAAASSQDEMVQIARRVKKRLLNDAKPDDIIVVFRSLAEAAPRIREVFTQYGIPFFIDTRLPIAGAPIVKTLLALLRLDDENWPFRRVVSVLTNSLLTAIDGGARQAADWLVRDLQFADGRARLLERVEELATEKLQPTPRSEHVQRRIDHAATAQSAFRLLATALDDLPTEATPTEWRDALSQLTTRLGFHPDTSNAIRTGRLSDQSKADETSQSSEEAPDAIAWNCLARHFASLARMNDWLGEPDRKLTRRELISFLVDVASHESLPRPHDDVGRVRVLAAPSARTVCAKHLFLAGMSEQAFPSPERAGRLSTEADYRFFSRAAHQDSPGKSQRDPAPSRAQEEMLLFYEVLSRAQQSLTISYPALDDKAQDLPPSPYVTEIERALGGEKHVRPRRTRPQLSSVPQDATPTSCAEWRVRAMAQALDGNRHLLAGLFSCPNTKLLGAAIDAGVRIVHARARSEFGPSEGLLASPLVADRLAQRFGPLHLWSPSQWETYAACPYKFFLADVLGLEPLGDLVLETDIARRGSRLHNVLATFHRQWPEVRGQNLLSAEEEAAAFLAHLQKVLGERLAGTPRGGIDAALLELDRRQIAKWSEKHFEHHQLYAGACAKLGGQMMPMHLEFRFGPARPGDENDPNSTPNAFVLKIGDEEIRVIGQIDRIDVGTIGDQMVFNVIDYKSGKKTALKREHIDSGERLQLPIYVEAARELVFGGKAVPLAAAYWSMEAGFDAKGALAVEVEGGDRWEQVQASVRERVGQFVTDIRHGNYPVASRDDKCTSYCEFHTVCRVSQVRSLGKQWPSACGLAPDQQTVPGDPLGRG